MSFEIDLQSLKPVITSVPAISTTLKASDYWGAFKVRWGIQRDRYKIDPGIYRIGNPDAEADVLVTSNYKLSFDVLRKNLGGISAWILVLDTNGINVWCAAGKGTFGTDNLVRSIKNTGLENIVRHRTVIVPQLGAPGIAAHKVRELCGFRVKYGPIRAGDIKSFIDAGYKAVPEMRKVNFLFSDRIKVIPVDFASNILKLLLVIGILFFISGLDKDGFIFLKMLKTGYIPVLNVLAAYLAGIVLAPVFLPWIPLRAFALKGAVWAVAVTLALNSLLGTSLLETVAMGIINISLASWLTMNFTGSSTYTSLSGVRKEMKWAIPFQIAFVLAGLSVYIYMKLI
jgi:acetyl-CoA decarbonylase/synthase complex subunit gamma